MSNVGQTGTKDFFQAEGNFTPFNAFLTACSQENYILIASGAAESLLHGLVHG
jgi:hypothetical protein